MSTINKTMKITKETKLKDLIPKGFKIKRFYQEMHKDGWLRLNIKKKEKTLEQLTNNLDYKLGDVCWYRDKKYFGKIRKFGKHSEGIVAYNDYYVGELLQVLTNKVAIHCPTIEDFKYINQLLKIKESIIHEFHNKIHVVLNTTTSGKSIIENPCWFSNKDYLILTVDEYCKAMNIKPLFITEDGKNIYEWMDYWFIDGTKTIRQATKPNLTCINLKKFSTKQAAQQYNNLNFKIGNWYETYNDDNYSIACYSGKDFTVGFEEGVCIEDTNWIWENDKNSWRPADMNKVKDILLKECKERYPVGSRVYPIFSDNTNKETYIVIGEYYWAKGDNVPACWAIKNSTSKPISICLFLKNKWAVTV